MKVVISELPLSIQRLLPYSIRSLRDEYELEELPRRAQELVRDHISKVVEVQYGTIYDCKPSISKYADLQTTPSIKSTIVEYIKNYFYIMPNDYPFDPQFGCNLKALLHQKDTAQNRLLITEEVNKIITNISRDLGVPIQIDDISIRPIASAANTTYQCDVSITVQGEKGASFSVVNLE